MSDPTVWHYKTPTSKLWLENINNEYRLTGEFEGRAHELGSGPDLKVLIISLASSLDTSDPFMRGIKTLEVQGETHGWDLSRMVLER